MFDKAQTPKPERQKSLAADLAKQQKMCQAQWAEKQVQPKAFQVKTESLQRWTAASKIKAHLTGWLKAKKQPDVQACTPKQKGSSCASQPGCQMWQDEPNPPDSHQLEALLQLNATLLEHHGSMAQAFKYIANTAGRDATFTRRDLRKALHLMNFKNLQSSKAAPLPDADVMFAALLALLRRSADTGEIRSADFLRVPELLERERALREKLLSPIGVDDDELLVGDKLARRLASGVESPGAAEELLQKLAVALEFEPRRTANLLMQSSGSSGGVKAGLQYIADLTDEFGAPKAGTRLQVLMAGWALCGAFTRQAIALGAAPRSDGKPAETPQKTAGPVVSSMMKVKKAVAVAGKGKKNTKADVSQQSFLASKVEDSHENACRTALWEALPPGKVLWSLAHGAEDLDEEDFEHLLQAAWGLFDSFDAVAWVLGPVGLTRLRPKLDELAALRLRPCALSRDLEHAQAQLVSSHSLLQHVASMCAADPRLASTAALYGVPFLAERARSCANASVNLVADEVAASQGRATAAAAAQLNRVAAALATDLLPRVEELLGGRKVESGADLKKLAAPAPKRNPLKDWHRSVTMEVNASAVALLSVDEAEYRWGKILSDPILTDNVAVSESIAEDAEWGKSVSAP